MAGSLLREEFLIGVGIEGGIFESSPLQGEVRWGSGKCKQRAHGEL